MVRATWCPHRYGDGGPHHHDELTQGTAWQSALLAPAVALDVATLSPLGSGEFTVLVLYLDLGFRATVADSADLVVEKIKEFGRVCGPNPPPSANRAQNLAGP